MYSDCLNAIDGANGLLDNVDVSLLGVKDGESLVCRKCSAFVKQCPRAYNWSHIMWLILLRVGLRVSSDTPFCKLETLLIIFGPSLGKKKFST